MEMIYVDESGDHADGATNPEYPIFVIVACVFDKRDYRLRFVPDLIDLKIKYWSHEAVVLHEREIRKNQGEFTFFLTVQLVRDSWPISASWFGGLVRR